MRSSGESKRGHCYKWRWPRSRMNVRTGIAGVLGLQHRDRRDFHHELRCGKRADLHGRAGGHVGAEVFETHVTCLAVFRPGRDERGGLDHIGKCRTDGCQSRLDVLAHLTQGNIVGKDDIRAQVRRR